MTRLRPPRPAEFGILAVLISGCGSSGPAGTGMYDHRSEPEKVRAAAVSILFVGNSHTTMHGLPRLIGEMIQYRHPAQSVYANVFQVEFLEDVAEDTRCKTQIESAPWKYLVLQAQKESQSGRFEYSLAEGIEMAKLGKARGCKVIYYSEWGLKDVPGHGPRIEKIYRKMADASGTEVAPVGRAWELALAARPELELYAADGNHQTALGAFLTACVLFSKITGESPSRLVDFPYGGSPADRKFLVAAAAQALGAKEVE